MLGDLLGKLHQLDIGAVRKTFDKAFGRIDSSLHIACHRAGGVQHQHHIGLRFCTFH